jgi:hypothetical protein
MADKRISQLVERTDIANNDVVPIVASGATTTNKATISSIQEFMQENLDLGVTSVGITLGSSGTDVSVTGSPITTSGNITINFPTASATNRGLLSSADWTTFNDKQPAGNYVTLDTAQTITAQKVFTTSGSSDSVIITHGSGSGFALDVIKAGNGEVVRVNKTSGSGNAMSIIGGNFGAEAATFSGVVTTTPDAVINGVNVGKGGGSVSSNTRLGNSSLSANTTGTTNTGIGNFSLQNTTTGNGNTAIGFASMQLNTTGGGNTAVGLVALTKNTTGNANTATGAYALENNTTGSDNTAFGQSALENNIEGAFNTSIGSQSLHQNTTGSNNTAAGRVALRDNTTGSQNAAFGNLALYFNTTGSQNTGIGYSALGGITTGINNVAVGHIAGNLINSGTDNATSNNSVYIGQDTRASANGNTNEIVIGSAGRGNGSNTVTLGNSSITDNYFTGNIRGGAFIKSSGTSSQFLKADGSVDSNAYLPLTGGTLSGSLGGTSASFSGDIQTSTRLIASTSLFSIILTPNLGGTTNRIESLNLPLEIFTSGSELKLKAGAGNAQVTLASNGALSLTGALNGTSASFTGAVAASSMITVSYGDIDTGNNRGIRIVNTDSSEGTAYNITSGRAGQNNGDFVIRNTTTGVNNLFFNRTTGAATFSSSVGVGTSVFPFTPRLAVNSTGQNTISVQTTDTAEGSAGTIMYMGTGATTGNSTHGVIRVLGDGGTSAANLVLQPSSGNVGIGTVSPYGKLQVSGGHLVIQGNSTAGTDGAGDVRNAGFAFRKPSSDLISALINTTDVADWGMNMHFFTRRFNATMPATPAMTISSEGNVGIGTDSPQKRLDVFTTASSATEYQLSLRNGAGANDVSAGIAFGFNSSSADPDYLSAISSIITNRSTRAADLTFLTAATGTLVERMRIRNDGLVFINGLISSFTTGSAANMFVSAGDGAIYRSTSSIKYKKNVEDYDKGLTEVMQMRPVFYEGISESDEGKIFAGLIAEEVHDLGLTEFVQYAEDGSPDSLAYQNMVALLIKAIQELKAEIDSLKTK